MENRWHVCYPSKGIWTLVRRKVIFVDFIHLHRGFILKSAELKSNHVVMILNHCILVGIFEVKVYMNSLCRSYFKPFFPCFFFQATHRHRSKVNINCPCMIVPYPLFLFIVVLILILFFPYWRDIILTNEPIKFVYYV